MEIRELEELVNTIRQFISTARNRNDVFEYCRLCDELKMVQAELAEADCNHNYPSSDRAIINPPLALV
ncbi:MAG: hypothetical protein JWP00_4363 [Chloroflexi bacterium]|jgi:hypothetical protein|nr:hypothetical protein [Chloroflexota bacterium]